MMAIQTSGGEKQQTNKQTNREMGNKYLAVVRNKSQNIPVLIPPFMSGVFAGKEQGLGIPQGCTSHSVYHVGKLPRSPVIRGTRTCACRAEQILPRFQSALKCKPPSR